jgi:hypothetical protein
MPRKKNAKKTSELMLAMIQAYAQTGHVGLAASLAGITRRTHERWMQKFPKYATAFNEAKREAGDELETECMRRAMLGVEEPVYYQGNVCGHIKRYSDGLAQFLLRGIMPERYGSKTEVSGPQSGP